MEFCKFEKGISPSVILLSMIFIDFAVFFLSSFIDLYMTLSLIRIFLVVFNIYGIYYFLLSISIRYTIDEENLYIVGIWGLKKVKIPFSDIEGYKTSRGIINGVKLSGVGKDKFAFGRYVLEKIGTTRMFVTSKNDVVYLKTRDINYAISPESIENFTKVLKSKNISPIEWEYLNKKEINLHKEKDFMIPFIIVSVIIVLFTVTPLFLYIKNLIPNEMPLSFDAKFQPVRMGTGKQFAFKQTTYGVLNMAILFCMYYAAHFHAKYDRKSANRYIYASLIISIVFFVMQIKTILNFIL